MEMSFIAKAMYCFLYVAELTVVAFPVGVFLLLMDDPCTPPFLLSAYQSCSNIAIGPRVFLVLFEAWISLQLANSGTTWAVYILFAGILAILNYLDVLRR